MQRPYSLFVSLLLCSAAGVASAQNVILPSPSTQKSLARNLASLPLSFESNQGQTHSNVRFLTHTSDSALFLTPSEAVFSLGIKPSLKEKGDLRKDHNGLKVSEKISRVAMRMQMVGSNPKASVLQQQPLAGRINYFIGKDPSKWHAGVPTFGRVGFYGVYPGVDLVYYGNQRHLEYDFVVAPHADPKQIKLHFAGAERVRVNAAGDLLVRVQGRELKWRKPTVYQQDAAGKHSVAARFRLKKLPNGQAGVSFALGHYDSARTLIIDPVLLYSTYLGGTTDLNGQPDQATGIAVDSAGNAYVTGKASSTNFPVTSGAFQQTNNSMLTVPLNAFVTKLNATGTALVYSTYLGGHDGQGGVGIAVDSAGNAYVTGDTTSTDFPTTPGAFQPTNRGAGFSPNNAFVTKLNPTGSALLYSTYLGGSTADNAYAIAIDSGGNAYVTGQADSANFPITAGAFQAVNHSVHDNAFVTKLNPTGTALVYSTYLGGTGREFAIGIAVDSASNAYVTGWAYSTDFPTTPGAFQRVNRANPTSGGNCAFVTKLNATGTDLLYSTYLGGRDSEYAKGIAVDSSGNAYVTGYTNSTDFPTTPGAFAHGKVGSFITKFNSTGTALVYSGVVDTLSGTSGFGATSIVVDSAGHAYVTGDAGLNLPTVPGAFQRQNIATGFSPTNVFVMKLNSTGTALLYSTYLGGSYSDEGTAIALDKSGNVYVTGISRSADFPVTAGAFQTTNHGTTGGINSFVTKLSPVPIFPDFNNDGSTDLLIQNSSTGVIANWFMQGSHWVGGAYFSQTPPVEYALVGAGDFSGDGNTTLVLQSRNTNQIAFWFTSGANHATIPGGHFVNTTPDAGWKVVGAGDFNNDGKSDLVFQNQTTNQVAVWFMNGYLYQGGVLLPFTPPTDWKVVGTGDLNADGFTDLVFQNQSTGQIALWYLNGTTYVGGTVMPNTPGAGWKVVGVGDYNGDSSADLLFQNQTSNQAMVWYLSSGLLQSAENLSLNPPAGWQIVGPR